MYWQHCQKQFALATLTQHNSGNETTASTQQHLIMSGKDSISSIEKLRALPSDTDRYVALRQLQVDDAPLFWSLVWQHTQVCLSSCVC